jgi:hypothetical protein
MTDPKRLSSTSDSEIERALLRAARAPAPEGARDRALLVASAASAASAAVAASSLAVGGLTAGNAAAGLKISSLAVLKWVGFLSLASAGVAAGAVVVRHVHRAATAPTPSMEALYPGLRASARGLEESRLAVSAPAAAPEVAQAPSSHTATSPSVAPTRSTSKTGDPGGSTVPAELAMLERARAAMKAGELSGALSILDSYIDRFPHGAMAPEAAVLRIETLLRAGDRPAATRFANAFLALAPHSPYAARIQSLFATSSP